MDSLPATESKSIAAYDAALQHRPRPLPAFLSLLQRECAANPARLQAALAGLRAYQAAERPPRPAAAPVVAGAGRAVLRDYGGDGRPAIFVPSIINPPDVLDLTEGNSLLRWLATQGVRPLLVDWGQPGPDDRDMSVAGHVESLLLPLIEAIGRDAALVGYCLGGTMALAAAALAPVDRLALIAAPWHFSGFPDRSRSALGALWTEAAPVAETLGVFPMEVLQTGFWELDPARVVDKYAAFAAMTPDGEEARGFVALEDWSNAGAPLTLAAGRELMESFVGADATGEGRWRVSGRNIAPDMVACPVFDIVSTSDRIVPLASSARFPGRLTLSQGHVGMVVGKAAQAVLWEPLARWLSQSREHC